MTSSGDDDEIDSTAKAVSLEDNAKLAWLAPVGGTAACYLLVVVGAAIDNLFGHPDWVAIAFGIAGLTAFLVGVTFGIYVMIRSCTQSGKWIHSLLGLLLLVAFVSYAVLVVQDETERYRRYSNRVSAVALERKIDPGLHLYMTQLSDEDEVAMIVTYHVLGYERDAVPEEMLDDYEQDIRSRYSHSGPDIKYTSTSYTTKIVISMPDGTVLREFTSSHVPADSLQLSD